MYAGKYIRMVEPVMHKLDTRIYARMHCMVHVLCVCMYIDGYIKNLMMLKTHDSAPTHMCTFVL